MRSVRSIEYRVHGVTNLVSLLEMMRYDKFRFPSTGEGWQEEVLMLAERAVGIINQDAPAELMVRLVRDQLKGWTPTTERWASFGMAPIKLTKWDQAQELS